MNALQLVTLAAIWGASFLFMRMGAPDFGVVPLIALRASNASPGTDDATRARADQARHAPCVLAGGRQRMKSEGGVTM
ncbi:hypothetical protein [Burkholderia lata]|uniref:Uncharacterized protein n=1 Tax=Burkholderia lata (strain ATCC 17760 / DSM 23089 / LMG 22485 / NCIMB 9086 / R18194 / 383) TaxID=482957 RepID=Q39A31_BURL3|nr:hypothetical protein Bcep18194_B0566 [Burkholderia lata]